MRNSASNYRYYVSERTRSRPSRSGGGDSFFSFLYIIAGVIILALFYQLGSTWFDQQISSSANKLVAQVESGSAQIMPWGESEWRNLYSGSAVFEGDHLQLAPRSQMFLTTDSGAAIRFGDAAEFELVKISEESLDFTLTNGRAWAFPSRNTSDLQFIFTGKRVIASSSRQFDFATLDEDAVRVFDGAVTVSAINDSGKKLDSFVVGVGQEAIVADEDIVKLSQGRSINFIGAINDEYKQRDWYVSNTTNDPRGIEVVATATPESSEPNESAAPVASGEPTPAPTATAESGPKTFVVPTPKITSHGAVSNSDKIQEKIEGTVDPKVVKVVVDHTANGNTFSYELKRFKSGSGVWNYTAVGGQGSNMESGENVYEVYAYDTEGNVSDKAKMTIHYYPGGIPTDAPAPQAQPTEKPSQNTGATPVPTPTPKVASSSLLAAPAVNSYNDQAANVTTEDKVKVVGTVDPTSIRVFVNGFALTAYRPGERQWTYYAATKYQTLTDGENRYKVYSVDKEGNRSPITEFTIVKNQPGEAQATESAEG